MAVSHNSEEQNFWPGYVDTLVNMVMFLVLLVIILAMAVTYFAAKAKTDALNSPLSGKEPTKTAYEKVFPGETDEIPVNPTMEDMRKLVDRLKEKLYQSEHRFKPSGLNPVATDNKMGKSEKIEAATGTAGTLPAGVQDFALRPTSLIIRFKPGSLELTDDEAKRLTEIFITHFDYANNKEQNFLLTTDAIDGLSESNRMAFYRVVAVRNRLMAITGVPASKIAQKIISVPSASSTGVEAMEVRITKVD